MKRLREKLEQLRLKMENKLYTTILPVIPFLNTQGATKDPSAIINSMLTDVIGWMQGISVGYATVYGTYGIFKYMSSNPNDSLDGIKVIKRACLGVVGVYILQTVLLILKSKSQQWG